MGKMRFQHVSTNENHRKIMKSVVRSYNRGPEVFHFVRTSTSLVFFDGCFTDQGVLG